MEKYLIVLDMDGTLLNDDKIITPLTRDTLVDLKNMGHKIIFASGRPFRTMQKYYDELSLDTPLISYNGGAIYGGRSSYLDEETTFNLQDVLKIYERLDLDILLNCICETFDSVYLLHDDEAFLTWFNYEDINKYIGDFKEILNVNPMTLLFHFKEKNDAKEISKIARSINPSLFVRSWSGEEFAELTYDYVNKYKATLKVASFYNIDEDHIISFGDALNDIEMMEKSKISIAMKNASEEVKEKAMYVTKEDNNHDGIALFLKSYFNL